jgi:Zn-dependent peptidase ImmA (M78 family)
LDATVKAVATRYRVSREVILRRLLDRELVTEATYEAKARAWSQEYLDSRAELSGGNYYATQATYLGPSFLHLAFTQFHAGAVSLPELADHLGVKARLIPRLEAFVGSDV